jgi:hypothetical protein
VVMCTSLNQAQRWLFRAREFVRSKLLLQLGFRRLSCCGMLLITRAWAPVPRSFRQSKGGLTAKIQNVAVRPLQCVLEFLMKDVVELILNIYQSMRPLDVERAADSRQKISRYIEILASAGQRDAEQLTIYGLAYLTELHEGQDPRFTGC